MTTEKDEQALNARVKQILDMSADAIDPRTVARLRAARHRAVNSTGKSPAMQMPRWLLPLGALGSLTVIGLLAIGWLQRDVPPPMAVTMDEAELLFAVDNVELYRNLDFYRWLAAKERSG